MLPLPGLVARSAILFVVLAGLQPVGRGAEAQDQNAAFQQCVLNKVEVRNANPDAIMAIRSACASMYAKDITSVALSRLASPNLQAGTPSAYLTFTNMSPYNIVSVCVSLFDAANVEQRFCGRAEESYLGVTIAPYASGYIPITLPPAIEQNLTRYRFRIATVVGF
jgi:hypothetical protein